MDYLVNSQPVQTCLFDQYSTGVNSQVHIDTISRQFSEARNKSGLAWIGRTPPTFHELRSLSERLYRDQGVDTQTLLGHRHARTTEIYDDLRGAEWETVLVKGYP